MRMTILKSYLRIWLGNPSGKFNSLQFKDELFVQFVYEALCLTNYFLNRHFIKKKNQNKTKQKKKKKKTRKVKRFGKETSVSCSPWEVLLFSIFSTKHFLFWTRTGGLGGFILWRFAKITNHNFPKFRRFGWFF